MTDFWTKIKRKIVSNSDLTSIGISNIIALGVSGLFTLFIANLLGSVNFGEISYYIAIGSIFAGLAFGGTYNAMVVYVAKNVKIQSTLYFISFATSVIFAIIAYAIFNKLEVSIFIIGYVQFSLFTNELLGRKSYGNYSKIIILQRITLVILAVLFYYLIGPFGIIFGYAISFFLFIIPVFKTIQKMKIDLTLITKRIGFMINGYVLEFSKMLQNQVDKIIIYPLFGAAILGNYQLAFQVIVIMNTLPGIVYQYTLSQDSSGYSQNKLKQITVICSVSLTMLVIVLAPTIVPILFPEYDKSIEIIQIMSLAAIPITINMMYISKFLGNEMIKIVVIGSCTYIAIQILMIITIGNIYHIQGVAASFVIASISESVYLFIVDRKMYNNIKNK